MNEFDVFENQLATCYIVFFIHVTIYMFVESILIVKLTKIEIYANHKEFLYEENV